MENLDLKTLLTVYIIAAGFSVIIFTYHLLTHKNSKNFIKLYTIAKILQLTCVTLTLVFAKNLTPFIMTLTLFFHYPGLAIESYCLIYSSDIKPKIDFKYFLLYSFIFVLIYYFVSSNLIVRVLVTSIYYSSIFGFVFIFLIFNKRSTKIQKLIALFSFFYMSVNLIRGFFTIITKTEIPFYNQLTVQVLFGVSSIIIAFSFPILFLLVIKEGDLKHLVELNGTKDKFFKIIGHDLKTPIIQMVQLADIIKYKTTDLTEDELKNFAEIIKDSSSRSFKLLENLLNWSRSNLGDIKFSPKKVSINDILNIYIEPLIYQASYKNIEIVKNFSKNIEIDIDENMFDLILRNLVSNGIKYTQKGGKIEISTDILDKNIVISIKDNGVGISKDICKTLFNIAEINSTYGTDGEKGTGLGLILSKEFVEKHGGEISVKSEVGKGTIFSFSLPLII